ncbi:MAG: hypothetical protein R2753_10690 [Chitinophagales bacterium]
MTGNLFALDGIYIGFSKMVICIVISIRIGRQTSWTEDSDGEDLRDGIWLATILLYQGEMMIHCVYMLMGKKLKRLIIQTIIIHLTVIIFSRKYKFGRNRN